MDKSVENRLNELGLIEKNSFQWDKHLVNWNNEDFNEGSFFKNYFLGNWVEHKEHCSTYFLNREKVYYDGYWREDKVFCSGEVKYTVGHKEGDIYLCERCYHNYINKRIDKGLTGYRYYLCEDDDKEYSSAKRYIDRHNSEVEDV